MTQTTTRPDFSFESTRASNFTHCTLFIPNKDPTCFTTFSLCGNSFLQSQRARALSLTADLVAGFGALITPTQPQSLARNWTLTSNHCRPSYPGSTWAWKQILPQSSLQWDCSPNHSFCGSVPHSSRELPPLSFQVLHSYNSPLSLLNHQYLPSYFIKS